MLDASLKFVILDALLEKIYLSDQSFAINLARLILCYLQRSDKSAYQYYRRAWSWYFKEVPDDFQPLPAPW